MRRHLSHVHTVLAPAIVMASVIAGCGSTKPATVPAGSATAAVRTVVAAFYPIEYLVDASAGDGIRLVTLVGPGTEPHDYEPTPRQVADLERADLVIYLGGGFQPAVERVVAALPADVARLDLLADAGDPADPHVWLSPRRMLAMRAAISAALAEVGVAPLAPDGGDLQRLDEAFRTGLGNCSSATMVTTHDAFGHLAADYGLTQVPIAVTPSAEPSAKDLERVVATARAAGVSTVFAEEALPAALAETVAGELGVTVAVLDTLESLSADKRAAGQDYITIMQANLVTLRKGLGCR